MRRLDCHARIKEWQTSYDAALRILRAFSVLAHQQPHYLLNAGVTLAEVHTLAEELNGSYFIRTFASFESSLRDYWRTDVKDSKPRTEHLIASIARRRGVPEDLLDLVQEVRNYRNHLIHGEQLAGTAYTISNASKVLNTFLARLPLQW